LAELSDLGVHVITHDIDTRQESAEILGAVQGAMNSLYRKEISRRTRRGLEGCALAGKSTGGKTFGYGPGEADVVRRIFTDAARGVSQANIALQLTYEGIPAPRGGAWRQSTVAYILKNVRYSGQVEWGRTICRRSAVDSRRQRVIRRSGGPLVSRFDESLRIVA
jgi:DNA invertase Pin-like site-specific DNA recombinase